MISPDMTRKLLGILKLAEARFGPRVPGWTIKPVLVAGANFPETTVDPDKRTVQVRITASTARFSMQAAYQLSHEVIHCLAPAGRRDTIWFEEGLANHFALTFHEISARTRIENEQNLPALLRDPLQAFRSLNASDERVRSLREEQPWFDLVTPADLQKHFSVSAELAAQLCSRLPEDRPAIM